MRWRGSQALAGRRDAGASSDGGRRFIAPATRRRAGRAAARASRGDHRRRRDRRRACGSPSSMRGSTRSSISAASRAAGGSSETAEAVAIGAGVTYSDAMAALGRALSRPGRDAAAASRSVQIRNAGTIGGNIANGSPIGDSPPVADRARRHAACCAAASERRDAAARGLLHRLRQAGPAAGRVRRDASPCRKPAAGTRFRCLQDQQALRPGHLGRAGGVPARRSTASAVADGAASPSAAWRRRPKRARARRGGAGRQALDRGDGRGRASTALATDFTPITDMRASAGYRLRGGRATCCDGCFIETAAARAETRLVGDAEPRPCLSRMLERRRDDVRQRAHDSAAQARHRRGALHRRHARAGGHCCTSTLGLSDQAHARITSARPRRRCAPRRASSAC